MGGGRGDGAARPGITRECHLITRGRGAQNAVGFEVFDELTKRKMLHAIDSEVLRPPIPVIIGR